MTVDELQVLITANTAALQKEIAKANKSIEGLQKKAEKSSSGFSSAFKKLKTAVVALGIGKVIKDSIEQGMNAVESDSLFETSLNKWSNSVRSWSDEMANALGLSAVNMRKNIGVIYNMTSSMGVAEKNALKMSKGISLLSEDMASFYNLDSAEAFNKLRAGLTGETEPLKALGILVDEGTVKQVAYSEGIAQTGAELTQQQKVLARYVAILKQTGNAQGDLARTLDSPANQMRLLKNQVREIGLELSNFFLPVVQTVLPYINAFAKVITSALSSLAKFMGLKSTSASTETSKISSNIGAVGTGLDNANKKAKALKNTMSSLDELHTISSESDSSSSGDSGAGVGGQELDFDLSEYDAHLEWINSRTNEIAEHIKSAFSDMGTFINSVWQSEPVQAYVDLIVEKFNFVKSFVIQIGTDLWNNITTTWSNIQGNVSVSLSNMSSLFTLYCNDITNAVKTWGPQLISSVSGIFNSIWKDAIDPVLQLVTGAWADFTGILLKLWQEYGEPLVNNIGEFANNVIGLFQSIWDNVINPIVTPFLETLSWLWEEHISKWVESIGGFIGKLVNGALEIYNGFIHPIVTWILDFLSPVWAFISNYIIGKWGTTVAFIGDRVSSIIGIFGGLIDFITGVFTGNWKKAWNGVKAIFKNIIDGLVGIFKYPINLIIDGINSFIAGLNKVKVPDWVPIVGGKGINIPKIPKLARGAIIEKPTVAMIGEAGTEAVMPLENNTGWIDTLADKLAEKVNFGATQKIDIDISGKLTAEGNDLVYVYDKTKNEKGYDGKNNPSFAY